MHACSRDVQLAATAVQAGIMRTVEVVAVCLSVRRSGACIQEDFAENALSGADAHLQHQCGVNAGSPRNRHGRRCEATHTPAWDQSTCTHASIPSTLGVRARTHTQPAHLLLEGPEARLEARRLASTVLVRPHHGVKLGGVGARSRWVRGAVRVQVAVAWAEL